jgi:hypothetical protein
MMTFLFYLIQFTWGLLANIIGGTGFLIFLFTRYKHESFYNAYITYVPGKEHKGAISLGIFIFVTVKEGEPHDKYWNRDNSIHEYGHTYQNLILGPLYLFIIGVPSLVWAQCFNTYREKNKIDYYSFYTETWASKLGALVTPKN